MKKQYLIVNQEALNKFSSGIMDIVKNHRFDTMEVGLQNAALAAVSELEQAVVNDCLLYCQENIELRIKIAEIARDVAINKGCQFSEAFDTVMNKVCHEKN